MVNSSTSKLTPALRSPVQPERVGESRVAGALTQSQSEELRRVAVHEAGHVVAMRYLGVEVGGATIVPGEDYAGLVWSGDSTVTVAASIANTIDTTRKAQALNIPGLPLRDMSTWIGTCITRTIELLAGLEAEREFEVGGDDGRGAGDMRQAVSFAASIALSEPGGHAFLQYAKAEARSIISSNRPVVSAVADALVERGSLTGAEADLIIGAELARVDGDAEHARRARWATVLASAAAAEPLNEVST